MITVPSDAKKAGTICFSTTDAIRGNGVKSAASLFFLIISSKILLIFLSFTSVKNKKNSWCQIHHYHPS